MVMKNIPHKQFYYNGIPTRYFANSEGDVYDSLLDKYLNKMNTDKGYDRVQLYININNNYVRKDIFVHIIIAQCFIPLPNGVSRINNDMTVDHMDGNKKNNIPDNLRWLTRADNVKEGWKTGIIHARKSEDSNASKQSNIKITKACEMIVSGYTTRQISEELDIPFKTVLDLRCRRCWVNISINYDFKNHFRELRTDVQKEIYKLIEMNPLLEWEDICGKLKLPIENKYKYMIFRLRNRYVVIKKYGNY